MERTVASTLTPRAGPRGAPSDVDARKARLEALKNARKPDALTPGVKAAAAAERGRSNVKLGEFGDRERSRSRNYDIFLPKTSHIHTPKRQGVTSNPDKITRSASPTRVLAKRLDSGAQNYRTSLSAVSTTSRDELNSSSNTLDSSNDAISIHSDSPFRKRMDFNYMSLPHGRSSDRFKSVDTKAGKILRDYHRDKDRRRLELYEIQTGRRADRADFGASDDDRTPTAVNGHLPGDVHHVTFDGSFTTPSTSSCGSPSSPASIKPPPAIKISDVNGNQGNGGVIMENGIPLKGGKPLITAEYYCVKQVNYDELSKKFGNADNDAEHIEQTDEAVKKLNLCPVNGEKEKKSLASSISNFFRKMSPRLNRKSRSSVQSSTSSMADDDSASSQGSPSHVAKKPSKNFKSPISSPIRRLINGRKHSESSEKTENNKTEQKTDPKEAKSKDAEMPKPRIEIKSESAEPLVVVKKDLEATKSLPPRTLDVEGRVEGRLDVKKRGLLSTRSTDSIGECSLNVNIEGSDPSLASGHQSCSVSKRTLHSTEPSRIPADPSRTNPMVLPDPAAVPTAGTGTTLHHDNHQYSYLGLSVSVGGYPKYRPFKNQELSKQNEDILNANKPSTNTSTQQQQQQNSSRPSSQPEFSVVNENSDMKSENLPNMVNGNSVVNGTNVNHSAVDGDDSVFVSKVIQDSSRIESEMKIQVTQTKKSEKTKPNLRVAINGTPEVMSVVGGPGSPGAGGEGGVHEVPPLTPRTRELRRGSVAKGGHFYLARVAEETARIRHFVAVCEADQAEPGKTEEVYGKLRAAAGKANLLVSQKFKQFIGLCEDNLHPDESKDENHETTNEDLAGFWDMMTIQIEDVDAAFADIQLMRENNWQEIQPPPVYRSLSTSSQKESTPEKPKRTPKKTAPASKTAKTRNDQKSRDEARKRLMEAKRLARRKRLTSGGSIDDVEIYIAEPEHKPTA